MREIKFKFIIENQGKKYISQAYELNNEDGLPDEEIIVENMEECTCVMTESVNCCEGECIQFEDAKVIGRLQYTGLKDKYGKEIYEGDIVYFKYYYTFHGYPAIVKYINGGFKTQITKKGTISFFENSDAKKCKIIGNKFENPELLKEEI